MHINCINVFIDHTPKDTIHSYEPPHATPHSISPGVPPDETHMPLMPTTQRTREELLLQEESVHTPQPAGVAAGTPAASQSFVPGGTLRQQQ